MISLDNAGTRALSLITAKNGADVIVAFSDFDIITRDYDRGVPTMTTIASATTTAICATPAANKIRDIDWLSIRNTYAGSHTMTLQITSGSGGPFTIEKFTLLQDETLQYIHGTGLVALDANGNRKEATASNFTNISASGTLAVTGTSTLAALNASGNVNINSGKFTVDAATGNTVVAGNVTAVNLATLGSANQKLFVNAAASAAEWALGHSLGQTTHDTSTTGSQAITGVGFKPSMLIIMAAINGTNQMSIGMANGANNYSVNDNTAAGGVTSNVWWSNNNILINLNKTDGVTNAGANLASFDSDGFTLTWSKTGSMTGTATITYMCFR